MKCFWEDSPTTTALFAVGMAAHSSFFREQQASKGINGKRL
jgi:hypothetical protein